MAYSQLLPFHRRMLADLESSKLDSLTGNIDWDSLDDADDRTATSSGKTGADSGHGNPARRAFEGQGHSYDVDKLEARDLFEISDKLTESSPLRKRRRNQERTETGLSATNINGHLASDDDEISSPPPSQPLPLSSSPGSFQFPQPAPVELDTNADFLMIAARGLAQRQIMLTYIKLLSHPEHLVFLINENQQELEAIREDLLKAREQDERDCVDPGLWGDPSYFKIVTTETMTTVNERCLMAHIAHLSSRNNLSQLLSVIRRIEAYLSGGVLATTSRILVADLLNDVVPVHLCQGFLVARAER
ncbi:hypothetical protein HDU93_002131 [Gonapodya sp. JEL0774]|nr:hypothetical protein HDU93_002131 [Gonapodya sp. JEL0774]